MIIKSPAKVHTIISGLEKRNAWELLVPRLFIVNVSVFEPYFMHE
jgi:hypothetical protein